MRVGTVCYATTQGLGVLAKQFYDAGIIQEVLIYKHPDGRSTHTEWYPPGTPVMARPPFRGPAVEDFLRKVDIVLFFETPFDWAFPRMCRQRRIKTALIPMYEWHLERAPTTFDLYINPSLLDQQYFPHGTFLPIPAVSGIWKQRQTARRFVHNSGHIGSRNHKGTEELLKSLPYIKSPIELTITSQETSLNRLIDSVPQAREDNRVTFRIADNLDYTSLFAEGDVYIAPEKYNGLSLPLQEAFAAGLAVMTTDRFPMNTWLPQEVLIPVERYDRAQTQGGHLMFDEAIVNPEAIANKIDEWYDKDITYLSQQGRDWAVANSWEVLGPKYNALLESVL